MASSKATIDWTSNDAQLLRSLEKVEKNMDDIARKLNKVEKASKRSAKSTEQAFSKVGTALKGVAFGIFGAEGILSAYQLWSAANQEVMREARQINQIYDDIMRKLRIQGGLSRLEGEEAQARLRFVANKNKVPYEQASSVALKLLGAGVPFRAATGKAATSILEAVAATDLNDEPINPESFSKAVVKYLNSQGKAINTANFDVATKRMINLVLNSPTVEGGSFSFLAKEAAALRGKLSVQEQFAAFTALAGVLQPAQAATGLRGFVFKSATVEGSQVKREALKKLGLRPEQVGFVNNSLAEVMNAYAGALARTPQAEATTAMEKIFGLETSAAAAALIQNRGSVARLMGVQGNQKQVDKAVKIAARGVSATRQVLVNNLAFMGIDADRDAGLWWLSYMAELKERGVTPFDIGVSKRAFQAARAAGANFGQATTLSNLTIDPRPGITREIVERLRVASSGDTGVDALNRLIEQQTKATEENTEAINSLHENGTPLLDAEGVGNDPRVKVPAAANLNGGGFRQ